LAAIQGCSAREGVVRWHNRVIAYALVLVPTHTRRSLAMSASERSREVAPLLAGRIAQDGPPL
jgi:hypothetical protein